VTVVDDDGWFVRAPASSANLGAGFDVLGMALDLYADCGLGQAPDDAQQLDAHHPGFIAFEALGGTGPMWMRCNIPMGRGLGFSGAARVGAAALAAVQTGGTDGITGRIDEILTSTTELEGHGDNAAASLHGGVTAFVQGEYVSVPVGPTMAAATFVAWVPDVTTSTDKSRQALGPMVERADAVHNIGRAIQFVMAFVNDDPSLLASGATDRMHQPARLPGVLGAQDALGAGVAAGAWAGWLSGSGPTVGFMCPPEDAASIAAALPDGAHTKLLTIDTVGCRIER
jgi:homoserine kinase